MSTIIATLVMVQITIACVTLYLHRSQAHKAVEFHPVVEHFMRFWLWLTTGMVTKEWVAIHRKHHQKSDTVDDPHSPKIYGIWRVLFGGAFLYVKAKQDTKMVNKLGVGTPDDWIERNLYSKYPSTGIELLLFLDFLIFGWWGFLVWLVQVAWIPFWAAGVINGLAHWWGYQNGETRDLSRNISFIGIIIGGECLHNNHHLEPANPKLSRRWFEFDIGWMYITLLKSVGLARLKSLN
mgnify:CR=1 FL=1